MGDFCEEGKKDATRRRNEVRVRLPVSNDEKTAYELTILRIIRVPTRRSLHRPNNPFRRIPPDRSSSYDVTLKHAHRCLPHLQPHPTPPLSAPRFLSVNGESNEGDGCRTSCETGVAYALVGGGFGIVWREGDERRDEEVGEEGLVRRGGAEERGEGGESLVETRGRKGQLREVESRARTRGTREMGDGRRT